MTKNEITMFNAYTPTRIQLFMCDGAELSIEDCVKIYSQAYR